MGVLAKPIPFGDYFLLEKINTGGMAEVFKAKTFGVEGFERIVAVKKILPSIAEDKEFISMFIDEAKIAGQLHHANIVQINDLGNISGDYYIAMEYVPGHDLRGIFDRCVRTNTKLNIGCVCYILSKICEGLDYAHNKKDANGVPMNIIHRDISPQNILISYDGECKLIDFGIAKATNKSSATQVGILKGKFSYMSPEQVSGKSDIDRRSDIFALGIVLFEMLTLKRLFLGNSDFETLEKIRKVEVSPPSLYNSEIPEELEDIVLKALEKDREARFQTCAEFQNALQHFMFNRSIYYTAQDLSNFCHQMFEQEIALEQKKMEFYQELTKDVLIKSRAATNSVEDETSFYEKQNVRNREGMQFEAAAQNQGKPAAPKQAIYAELDDFEPPSNEIVYSQKNSSAAHPAIDPNSKFEDIISAQVNTVSPMPRRSVSNMDPVVIKGRETIMAMPPAAKSNASRNVFLVIVSVLVIVIVIIVLIGLSRNPSDKHDGKLSFSINPSNVKIELVLDGQPPKKNLTSPIKAEKLSTTKETRYHISADGYIDVDGAILATADPQNINIELQRIATTELSITVNHADNAIVTVDNKEVFGAEQLYKLTNITPGEHFVVVSSRDGKYISQSRTVMIEEGISNDFTFDLWPAHAVLLLKTTPYSAKFNVKNTKGALIKEGTSSESGIRIPDLPMKDDYIITVFDGDEEITRDWTPKKEVELGEPQQFVITVKTNPAAAAPAAPAPAPAPAQRTDTPRSASAKSSSASKSSEPKETEPAKPANALPGVLKLNCIPAAEVYINGKLEGITPISRKLSPGTYKVRFVNKDQGINIEQTVNLRSGEEQKVIHRGK